MDSRVTLQTIVQGALADTRRLSDQLATMQAQAASGKKFQQVSDDPAAALAVLSYETQAQSYATHLENISSATSKLNASVATLQQVGDVFSQAHSLAIEASSSVNDTIAFNTMAQSVDALLSRLLNLANTQQNGAYLFGGTATHAAPFVVASADTQGRPLAVQYQGANENSSMFVDRTQQIALDYAGNRIFQAKERQATVFSGHTGAQPGSGTDSATFRGELLIRHVATTFAPGSGVRAGASSVSGDTILGPLGRHRLHITDTSGNGSAGTVSLDGGPAVAFSNADRDLAVRNAAGDTVHLDTTAITANFNGDVAITSNGAMSIDGGATSVALTFAADQSVTDGATGNVTFVNTTNVERTGAESVTYPGTADAFQTLMALRDDLRNHRNLSEHDQIQAISADLADLDRVHNQALTTIGSQSATLQSLQSLQSHLEDLQLNAKKTAGDLGDVDMSELVVKLQSYQNMLQLSLATFSRIVDQNLLDFLH